MLAGRNKLLAAGVAATLLLCFCAALLSAQQADAKQTPQQAALPLVRAAAGPPASMAPPDALSADQLSDALWVRLGPTNNATH